MKIGVPKETADGERRVALVPDVVKSLKQNEKRRRRWSSPAPATPPATPTPSTPRPGPRSSRPTLPGAPTWSSASPSLPPRRSAASSSNQLLHRPPRAPGPRPRPTRRWPQAGRHQLRDGGDPAHDARPGDGRALLAGRRRRLRREPDRRPRVGPLLRDDDHRRRHRAAGQGPRPRRRRRRPAGGRHRQAAGRDRHRLRHPPRRLGADRLARRPPAGTRLHPRRRGRGRLRAPAHRRGERAGARRARPRTPPSRTSSSPPPRSRAARRRC